MSVESEPRTAIGICETHGRGFGAMTCAACVGEMAQERDTLAARVVGLEADLVDAQVRGDEAEDRLPWQRSQAEYWKAEAAKLRDLLRRYEWIDDDTGTWCHSCEAQKNNVTGIGVHAPDCELAAALGSESTRTTKEEGTP